MGLIKQDQIKPIFWMLFVLTILTLVGMQITGKPLVTDTAPGGIVSFELVGTFEGSQQIIKSWQGRSMTFAGLNMGLDFLFLTLYGITIALGCLLISENLPTHWKRMRQLGLGLAAGVLLAAVLDIFENIALIKLLLGSHNSMLPMLAKWLAIPKFILILLALLYVAGGLLPAVKSRADFPERSVSS